MSRSERRRRRYRRLAAKPVRLDHPRRGAKELETQGVVAFARCSGRQSDEYAARGSREGRRRCRGGVLRRGIEKQGPLATATRTQGAGDGDRASSAGGSGNRVRRRPPPGSRPGDARPSFRTARFRGAGHAGGLYCVRFPSSSMRLRGPPFGRDALHLVLRLDHERVGVRVDHLAIAEYPREVLRAE